MVRRPETGVVTSPDEHGPNPVEFDAELGGGSRHKQVREEGTSSQVCS